MKNVKTTIEKAWMNLLKHFAYNPEKEDLRNNIDIKAPEQGHHTKDKTIATCNQSSIERRT